MQDRVIRVLGMTMNVPVERLDENSSPDNVESWDSMRHMNLVLALEEEFNVKFSDEQMLSLEDVRSIVSILEELT